MKTFLTTLLFLILFSTFSLAQSDCPACEKDLFTCGQVCAHTTSDNFTECYDCFLNMVGTCCDCVMPNSQFCQAFVNHASRFESTGDSECDTCALDAANCATMCADSNGDYSQCLVCVFEMAQPCCDCFFPNSAYCQDLVVREATKMAFQK